MVPTGLPGAPAAFGDVEGHRACRPLRLVRETDVVPSHPARELAGRHPAADLHGQLVGAEGPYGPRPAAWAFAPTLRVVVGEEGGSLLHRWLRRASAHQRYSAATTYLARSKGARQRSTATNTLARSIPGPPLRPSGGAAFLPARRPGGGVEAAVRRRPHESRSAGEWRRRHPAAANVPPQDPDHRRADLRGSDPRSPPTRSSRSPPPRSPLSDHRAQCPKRAGTGCPRPGTAPQSHR